MNWWQSLVLGLTQGLAEFLPISSSGHLVLMREIMNVPDGQYMLFDVLLHVATLLAVIVAFYKEILALFKPPFKTIGLILLASIPAAVIGLVLGDVIDGLFSGAKYLCFFFLFSAVVMLLTEIIGKKIERKKLARANDNDNTDNTISEQNNDALTQTANNEKGKKLNSGVETITLKNALVMGACQAVAVFPGITRSGSTIFGGVVSGGKRESVARFSFFMSAPVILGATILECFDITSASNIGWWCYLIGMISAFVSGFFAIKLMMRLVSKANLKWFSLYLLILSVITFIFCFLGI